MRRFERAVNALSRRSGARVLLASVGDAGDPATFSGTPYHCLQAGLETGAVDSGLALETGGTVWRCQRLIWNLFRLTTTGQYGGYQWSEPFLERLWRQVKIPPGSIVVNFFQLFSTTIAADPQYRRWFYIDQTLHQLFTYYGFGSIVPKAVVDDAIARERDQYHAADGVICHTNWAARDVVISYGVPAERVHVVHCGANLDLRALCAWENSQHLKSGVNRAIQPNRPLRLVFVGKEWSRKGLDRLLRALNLARTAGSSAELLVIGVNRADLPRNLAAAPGVHWAGFIDKRREPRKFIDMVGACDVGSLLSRAEAGGMSIREFVRLGLPTIVPLTGGSPEFAVEGASHLFAPDASDGEIAEIIVRLATDADLLAKERAIAWAARKSAGWEHAVRQISQIISTGHMAE
jgi:glycosyltransferase involved in cell wall biosynthesis